MPARHFGANGALISHLLTNLCQKMASELSKELN